MLPLHRTVPSNGSSPFNKGGSIFSSKTPTRPSTSSGSPTTHSESHWYNSSTASTFRAPRKESVSSGKGSQRGRKTSIAHSNNPLEKKRSNSAHTHTDPYPLLPGLIRQDFDPKSADSFNQVIQVASAEVVQSPASRTDSFTSTTPYSNMLARPGTGYQAIAPNGAPSFSLQQPPSPTLETITYQHIQETSSKRISTLDYLRKAYGKLQILASTVANGDTGMKDEYTGSIHYYSTNPIYNECHILIPANWPGGLQITFFSASPSLRSSI